LIDKINIDDLCVDDQENIGHIKNGIDMIIENS